MGKKTKIEWAQATCNPVRGCRRKSAGCQRCYAERLSATRLKHLDKYKGLATLTDSGPRWTGKVNLDIEEMKKVLKWTKPKRIFVCNMSDLFYEEVPDDFIEQVFAIMAVAKHHTFQILTKRSDRMKEWFRTAPILYKEREDSVAWWAEAMNLCVWDARGDKRHLYTLPIEDRNLRRRKVWPGWPLPNVWVGVSVEDQEAADKRIPDLLDTPAAIRYVSHEPVLEAVDFDPPHCQYGCNERYGRDVGLGDDGATPFCTHCESEMGFGAWLDPLNGGIDWVIAGSESGPNARPSQMEWMKRVKDQCVSAGTAFFLKQFVENGRKVSLPVLDGKTWDQYPTRQDDDEHT